MRLRTLLALLVVTGLWMPHAWAPPAPDTVTIRKSTFRPRTLLASATTVTILWNNEDGKAHTATSKLPDLFDEDIAANGTQTKFLWGAGTFKYFCEFHKDMRGKLQIPMSTSLGPFTVSVPFDVFWANESKNVPGGYNADVQIKLPGTKKFVDWHIDQTLESDAQYEAAAPGTYKFRSRLQHTASGDASAYTPALKVLVSAP